MKNSNAFGIWAEQLAQHYLQQQGFTLLVQGYCCRYGEIDLIMVNAEQLIFVEVKARASTVFGAANESIALTKQRKIIRTAEHFLQCHLDYQNFACRFDVICIQVQQQIAKMLQQDFSQLTYDLDWIEAAFTLD
ncbi:MULTISPECIES: YraN family protein [unclassified Acinetobacter]|uniref:YraN family protein n=1 Tax=unclassified Acinetobacter TaxID=196816 RepID=UPI001039279C|nr:MULTISPECIES: YraN family protein [unclassified Acinetobacter]TCB11536.1 YraN family protein [Acinetobacter sp. ANC 4641]TCB28916.1 YraN family protein [Acinetobacter sp. ANC 4633]